MTSWRYTVDIKPFLRDAKHEWNKDLEQRRDEICKLLRKTGDYRRGDDYYLRDIIDELQETDSVEGFNAVLDNLYDWADDRRVWLGL